MASLSQKASAAKRALLVLLQLVLYILFQAGTAEAAAENGTISTSGPLTRIQVTPELNCAVEHAGDVDPEFFGDSACGTLVAVQGQLYGPASIPAGSGTGSRIPWSSEGQTSGGSGTVVNPYRVVTEVDGGGLDLTQTDTYVSGSESYGTRVSIENTTSSALTLTLYRAGDCYLQNSDYGYGTADPQAGAVACSAGTEPGSRIEQWAPLTSGSRYYESFYGSVWAAIGSEQPFPDTCDCDTYQDNGAGLSWTTTIPAGGTRSFSHLTAFSPTGEQVEDSDGDGFPDSWEEPDGGVDTNGDGNPDFRLSSFGATPDRPDIFVQVGWMRTHSCLLFFCSDTNRRPSLAALRDVQDAFSEHGIRLHIDAGPNSLMNPDTGATWGKLSRGGGSVDGPSRISGWNGTTGDFNWKAAFDGYRNTLLPAERRRLFHFALYVGSFNPEGNSGLARPGKGDGFAGADLMVARDVFNATRIAEAGTFMHELGHNLGLTHGGSIAEENVNYKPNYPSVMNYWWQFSGTYKNSQLGLLDYSEGTLEPLDEFFLSESGGLEPDSAASDIATKWSCPNRSVRGPSPSMFDVDWNCSGKIDAGTDGTNINNPAFASFDDSTLETMHDHDDWGSLVFDGGGALGGAGDPASALDEAPVEEAETAELKSAAGDLHTVELSGPEQLSIQASTAAPVNLTITNHHGGTRTYDLDTSTEGLSLAGLPGQVTLAGNETRTLPATLSAGAPSDSAFFEVDASSGEPIDADSAVAEVFVVAHEVADQPGRARSSSLGATRAKGTPPRVSILSRKARLTKSGKAKIKLSCGAGEGRCAGRLALARRAPSRAKGGKHRNGARWSTVASAPFSISAGNTANVSLTLPPSVRNLVASTRSLSFRATAATSVNTSHRQVSLK